MKPPTVTIFTKPGCGLCEEAEEVIEAVRARTSFSFERRNILENLDEYEKYKHDIPVILVDGIEIARHRLSEAALSHALDATPSPRTRGEGGGEGPAARGVAERSHAGAASDVGRSSTPRAPRPSPQPSPRSTGEREQAAIVVMAKYPAPGRVKTRLMPALTADQAASVQREFLLHVVARLAPRRVVVCFDPPESEFEMRRLLDAELVPQSAGDLGRRLAAATTDARRTCETVIFLGVDSPDVPLKYIDRISELLATHDVVIAPAEDGGYWAVALTPRVDPAKLFADIEWSTGRECAQTLERAKHLGYNVAVADPWADVDRPEDLRRLIERLKRSDEPGNRELLARLEFLPDGVV
jgi:uncharacterized protein